jgi:hypothetical protein
MPDTARANARPASPINAAKTANASLDMTAAVVEAAPFFPSFPHSGPDGFPYPSARAGDEYGAGAANGAGIRFFNHAKGRSTR